ncbi:SymE family type I addiction module toxin [Erwinia sp. P7711]|uniref:SymE family type I addiction module toxin n=1 Tax=Erwinia sp. P7711 TaxID=3141451 RepID=UPI0031910844
MAAQLHNSEKVLIKVRCYILGYIWDWDQRKFDRSPSITLKGDYIWDLGVETGRKVEVLCEQGKLIIRLA